MYGTKHCGYSLKYSSCKHGCIVYDVHNKQPRRDWNESVIHSILYVNRPLSVNSLGNVMKEISTKAKLSKVYTNHCVQVTAITLWSGAGLSDRHICHISGHRNPNSLQHYNCNVWRILASKLIPRFGERLYYCDSSNDLDKLHLLWNHVKIEIHCRSRTYSEHLDNFHDYGTSVHAV